MSAAIGEPGWGSDIIAHALREQGFPYVCVVPGASYRGLHDSIVNYLGNDTPKMITCLHEEHAVAIAHGYAQVTNEPLAVVVHSNVGLMHATMAIFNAWCDRAPVVVLGAGGPMDAEKRRHWIEWIHAAADQGALVRDYTKWDDQPASAVAAVDSIRRGSMIARTRPFGPVYVNLDISYQEEKLSALPAPARLDQFAPPSAPYPSPADVERFCAIVAKAQNPILLCGRMSRDGKAWQERVAFIEAIGARVYSPFNVAGSFPQSHPQYAGTLLYALRPSMVEDLRNTDLVISFDWTDLGGTLEQLWPKGEGAPPVVQCSNDFEIHRGWSMDYQRMPYVDLRIPTTPETLVSAALPHLEKQRAPAASRPAWQHDVPASGSIGVRDLAATFLAVTEGEKITLVSRPIGWPGQALRCDEPLDFLGGNGGGGVGAGPGMAVGAALAIRDLHPDRVAVAVLGDGDCLMGINALWSAAASRIPVLIIVANNRSYFNDEAHQERMAKVRGRPVENKWIGQRLDDPAPDIAVLAKGQGLEGIGPVTDVADLAAALRDGLAQVKAGKPTLIDVVVRGEYA